MVSPPNTCWIVGSQVAQLLSSSGTIFLVKMMIFSPCLVGWAHGYLEWWRLWQWKIKFWIVTYYLPKLWFWCWCAVPFSSKKTTKKKKKLFLLYKVHRLILAIVLPLTTRSKQKQQIPHTKKGNSTHYILFLNSFKSMFIFFTSKTMHKQIIWTANNHIKLHIGKGYKWFEFCLLHNVK